MHSACVSVRASAHHRGAVQDLGLRQVLLQLQHGLAGLRGLLARSSHALAAHDNTL